MNDIGLTPSVLINFYIIIETRLCLIDFCENFKASARRRFYCRLFFRNFSIQTKQIDIGIIFTLYFIFLTISTAVFVLFWKVKKLYDLDEM